MKKSDTNCHTIYFYRPTRVFTKTTSNRIRNYIHGDDTFNSTLPLPGFPIPEEEAKGASRRRSPK